MVLLMVGDVVLSVKEMNILVTALVAMVDRSFKPCSIRSNGSFNVQCTDGKRRRLSRDELVSLNNTLSVLAGQGVVLSVDDATNIVKEAVR